MPGEVASGESAAPESQQTGPGELLRARREDRGLSVEQVADELHLGRHIVAALEAEQFADIGAPVFVRGHLKAYARVLRLDEATVLKHCSEQLARFKQPKRVRFVDEIPHNATGKMLKRELRESLLS